MRNSAVYFNSVFVMLLRLILCVYPAVLQERDKLKAVLRRFGNPAAEHDWIID